MKVVSTEALTKLIQLVKSAFIKVDDVVEVTEIETETPSEVTLATVATSGSYDDLINKPTIPAAVTEATVSGWGFTKNTGTVTSVNNVSPVNGNVTLSIPTVPTNVSAFTNDSGYITSSALSPYALSADLASVATSGSYNDLSNKPTIPAAQVNSDWNATSGVAQILNKPTIPTVNNATLTLTQGGTNKGTFTANASSNVTIDLDAGGGNRNIGEIVSSTIPLTDAGLHLLDGSVISGNGIYSDFYNYIGSLVNTYPQIFCQEHEWQAEVASHGVCGKFVFYEPNRTVRLPKITGFIEGTNSLSDLGALTAAGLPTPNISIPTTGSGNNNSQWHMSVLMSDGGSLTRGGRANDNWAIQTLNANNSTIYGNSTTVQPQSIKVLYYIVIATSTKTDIEVDIDEIVTDLNGKANIDLSNITSIGREIVVGWGTPNYNAGYTVSSGFTASKSGVLKVYVNSNYPTIDISINGVQVVYFRLEHHYTDQVTYLVRVNKGDVATFGGSGTFYPDRGV